MANHFHWLKVTLTIMSWRYITLANELLTKRTFLTKIGSWRKALLTTRIKLMSRCRIFLGLHTPTYSGNIDFFTKNDCTFSFVYLSWRIFVYSYLFLNHLQQGTKQHFSSIFLELIRINSAHSSVSRKLLSVFEIVSFYEWYFFHGLMVATCLLLCSRFFINFPLVIALYWPLLWRDAKLLFMERSAMNMHGKITRINLHGGFSYACHKEIKKMKWKK